MTPVPESGIRRDPIEPAVGVSVFTNIMACFRCDGCGALSIRSMWTGDIIQPGLSPAGIAALLMEESLPFADMQWYPADMRGKRFPDVPKQIAAAATEAHKCLAMKAYRGAILLARSVVEATSKDKGITSGSLMQKIDAMHEARLVREDVRDGAHEIRFLGNDMAHGDSLVPASSEDAELVITLMDEVLAEIYQGPARVRRRRDAREAKKAAGRSAAVTQ